jgi:hypothetical protein
MNLYRRKKEGLNMDTIEAVENNFPMTQVANILADHIEEKEKIEE